METTIEAFIPMALGIARHQAALKHIDYDIAVSAGLEGVARAAATWDPKGKASFKSYATTCVRNAIRNTKKHEVKRSIKVQDYMVLADTSAVANQDVRLAIADAKEMLSDVAKDVLSALLESPHDVLDVTTGASMHKRVHAYIAKLGIENKNTRATVITNIKAALKAAGLI